MTDLFDPTVTIGPIAGSTRPTATRRTGAPDPCRPADHPEQRREHLDLYDTSGPYTDPRAAIDLHAGPPPRWHRADRGTQLQRARAGRSPRRCRSSRGRAGRRSATSSWSATRSPAAGP